MTWIKWNGQLAVRARVNGMVFAEAGIRGELLGGALIEPLLFESGRPVVVPKNGYARGDFNSIMLLIGWDGSTSAWRAVWDSIPLLRLAKTIEIVTVTGEKVCRARYPRPTHFAPGLSFLCKFAWLVACAGLRHGGPQRSRITPPEPWQASLSAVARSCEFVLGGVTREMLGDVGLPLLMSQLASFR